MHEDVCVSLPSTIILVLENVNDKQKVFFKKWLVQVGCGFKTTRMLMRLISRCWPPGLWHVTLLYSEQPLLQEEPTLKYYRLSQNVCCSWVSPNSHSNLTLSTHNSGRYHYSGDGWAGVVWRLKGCTHVSFGMVIYIISKIVENNQWKALPTTITNASKVPQLDNHLICLQPQCKYFILMCTSFQGEH